MASANYVKFLRGTPSAYAALETKDSDTLYFISATDSSVGKLYLGNILVAGNVTPDGESIIDSLGELIDVNLAGLKNGQILGYDGTTEKWIPMDLPGAISGSVMTGATADAAGTSGFVPAPQAGDQGKFLRGDGTWQEVSGADLTNYVTKTELETTNAQVTTNTTAISELNAENDSLQESLTWGNLSE